MKDISNHNSASEHQVANGASLLPTLADFEQKGESEFQSLNTEYLKSNNRNANFMLDEYRNSTPEDTDSIYKCASLLKVFETEEATTFMRVAEFLCDTMAAADKLTGGKSFGDPAQRESIFESLMKEDGRLRDLDTFMTDWLSKRPDALQKLGLDKCHAFLTHTESKCQEEFAEDTVHQMSESASTALDRLSGKRSSTQLSTYRPQDESPQELHLRTLRLYANEKSMTCATAKKFLKAIHPAFIDAITQYKQTLDALETFRRNLDIATALQETLELDSKSLLERWPKSFRPHKDEFSSKKREELLRASYTILGPEAGDRHETSKDLQKTGNELLGDAIQATHKPDPTVPGDYERWFCDINSRLQGRAPPSDSGQTSVGSPPDPDLGFSIIPPSETEQFPTIPPSDLGHSPKLQPSDLEPFPKNSAGEALEV